MGKSRKGVDESGKAKKQLKSEKVSQYFCNVDSTIWEGPWQSYLRCNCTKKIYLRCNFEIGHFYKLKIDTNTFFPIIVYVRFKKGSLRFLKDDNAMLVTIKVKSKQCVTKYWLNYKVKINAIDAILPNAD